MLHLICLYVFIYNLCIHTHAHTHSHIYNNIYLYNKIYVLMSVCV